MKKYTIAFCVGLLLLYSCTDELTTQNKPTILIDSLNVLSSSVHHFINNQPIVTGYGLVVQTTDSLDQTLAGTSADEALTTFIDSLPEEDREFFEKRIIFVYVSKQPALVQARTGSDLSMLSQWRGATAGQDYLKIQQLAVNFPIDTVTSRMVQHLLTSVPEANNLSWWQRMEYNQAVQFLGDELGEFSLPSESFYSTAFIKPAIKVRAWEQQKFGTWWITFLLSAIVIFIVNKLLDKILDKIFKQHQNNTFYKIGKGVVQYFIGGVLALPAITSAIILSNGRLEDILALQTSGIPYTQLLAMPTESFNKPTSFLFVVILGVLRMLKGFSGNSELYLYANLYPDLQKAAYKQLKRTNEYGASLMEHVARYDMYMNETMNEETFLEKPYYHAFWKTTEKETVKTAMWMTIALTLLPAAIVWTAIFLWIIPVFKTYIEYIKTFNKYNIAFQNAYDINGDKYKMNYKKLWMLPLFLIILFSAIILIKTYANYLWYSLFVFLAGGFIIAGGISILVPSLQLWIIWTITLLPIVIFIFLVLRKNNQYDETGFYRVIRNFFIINIIAIIFIVTLSYYNPQNIFLQTASHLIPLPNISYIEQTQRHEVSAKKYGVVVNAQNLNLRTQPSTQSAVKTTLTLNQKVEILRQHNDKWLLITDNKDTGFVATQFIQIINSPQD